MTKTVFITGASSGIGAACANAFAREGYRLVVCGRRHDRLEQIRQKIQKQYGTEVLPLSFDVRDSQAVDRAIGGMPGEWQQIDLLINDAGLALGLSGIGEGSREDWDQMIDTNVKGLLYVSRAIIPGMQQRKSGHIINIGSIAGRETYPNGNVYCATKYAVAALTQGMRLDLLPYGIKVSQISPGAVDTEFSMVRFGGDAERAKRVYKGYTPLYGEDVAEVVLFAASLPPHVNINDLLLMPTAQASATNFHKASD